ncbi:MAG: DNA repair protein RecN [Symbiobacteriia bacterium]
MLVEIYMESFALVDKLRLHLVAGFNVLTGETGAGKSIVIDAVELVLGGRASADYVRSGAERALVEAAFDVSGLPRVAAALGELGFETEGDTLVLSREVHRTGRSASRINGRPATLSMVRELSRHLLDLHGQHEHQSLLLVERHRDLLDLFGGQPVLDHLTAVRRLTDDLSGVDRELAELGGDQRDRARHLDLLAFQIGEIDAAALRPEEEEELASSRRLLANAERLAQAGETAYTALYESASGQEAAVDLVGRAGAALADAARLDPTLAGLLDLLQSARVHLEEAARELASYRDRLEFNPERLAEIEKRLDLITALKRKYGDSLVEVLAFRESSQAELERLESAAERRESLAKRRTDLLASYRKAASGLHEARVKAAVALGKAVVAELKALHMDHAGFEAAVTLQMAGEELAVHAGGADQVEFLFSANPGEPLRSLVKVASGGELSRVALALKVALSRVDQVPSLIFDEIDTGVSGRTAAAIGAKMAEAATSRQVICVTHHPQIAAQADQHVLVKKQESGGRAVTTLKLLNEASRVDELARMLGGNTITAVTIELARELLTSSRSA